MSDGIYAQPSVKFAYIGKVLHSVPAQIIRCMEISLQNPFPFFFQKSFLVKYCIEENTLFVAAVNFP